MLNNKLTPQQKQEEIIKIQSNLNIFNTNFPEKCVHYKRECLIWAECCNSWVECRHCHNETVDHILNRKTISKIKCKKCDHISKPSIKCENCDQPFGKYFCKICNFWTNDEKVYHCDDCGYCIKPKAENTEHCKTCGVCIAKDHVCCGSSWDVTEMCPVCQEQIINTTKSPFKMPCGHMIHHSCLIGLHQVSNFMCPTCKKTTLDPENAKILWESKKEAIQNTPMPEEYANKKANYQCNDCQNISECNFHIFGNICQNCDSGNTQKI